MNESITQLLKDWNLSSLAWNAIIIGSAVLLGLFLALFVKRSVSHSGQFSYFNTFFKHVGQPISFFLPLFWVNMALPILRVDNTTRQLLAQVLEIMLIINSAWLLIRIVRIIQDIVLHKFNLKKPDNLRERRIITQLQFIRRIIIVLILILTISAILLSFPALRKVGTGLLTGVGISGIIIGFAAQRSLGNLLAGFQIAFTQPIRIDDEVLVEGEFGWIEEITLTYVFVRLWDERRLVLPINYFIEKPFQNWTHKTANITGTVMLYTDYTIPVEAVRAEFDRLINNHPLWDKRASSLQVTEAKERVLQLRATISAANSGDLWTLRCHIREHLIKFITDQYSNQLPKQRSLITMLPQDDKK